MMVQSRVVDVSKRGVRQSASETRAMFSQFGEVLTVCPWRAVDGQDHAFVEFKYKVSRNFRERLEERTSFAIVRVGDSDELAKRFVSFKKAASSAPLPTNPTLDACHGQWKALRAQPMRHSSPAYRVKKHAAAPAASSLTRRPSLALDYGSPLPGSSSQACGTSERAPSSPARGHSVCSSSAPFPAPTPAAAAPAAAAAAVAASSASVSSDASANPRQPLLNLRNPAPVSPLSGVPLPVPAMAPHSTPRVHNQAIVAARFPPAAHEQGWDAAPPPPSTAAPATPIGRLPILDIRNITPGTECMLAPTETRYILPDLLAKNVTVNSYLKLATHYRDKNMLRQANEVAHAALKELRQRGELGRLEAMALNLFLSTVSTAYARACRPKDSQKYMLEAARYISIAWATDSLSEPSVPEAAAAPTAPGDAATRPSLSAAEPPALPLVQEAARPCLEPPRTDNAKAAEAEGDVPPRPTEDMSTLALAVTRYAHKERMSSPARTASISSDSPSERTVVLEDTDLHRMTLSEVLDMAGTLLKHAAKLTAREGH
ncbi:hypothetical protein AURDEDRAFT_185886 [Auricularia subglabra TFB-10046 SS5]|nr:hypothetical protein AURDEDRAFT_185886 [Auricularia subglabra TFB-10046 SS5]